MKHFLAVACASITGISLGAALHHKASISGSPLVPIKFINSLQLDGSNRESIKPDSETSQVESSGYLKSNQTSPTTNTEQLEKKLDSILEQQNTMRAQQSELNRELNTIQFRLDTHSASFRPLQSERNSKSQSSDFLPEGLTPLLPPKQ